MNIECHIINVSHIWLHWHIYRKLYLTIAEFGQPCLTLVWPNSTMIDINDQGLNLVNHGSLWLTIVDFNKPHMDIMDTITNHGIWAWNGYG